MKSVNQSSSELLIFDGNILIIAIYVHVMPCHPEERRTSYSRHSFEWTGVKECVDIQREEFHSFSIARRSHGKSTQCTTVADFNHGRRHATDSHCISLQHHRQQRILIARGRPLLVSQDTFSPPPALNISARHLDGRYGFVVQN